MRVLNCAMRRRHRIYIYISQLRDSFFIPIILINSAKNACRRECGRPSRVWPSWRASMFSFCGAIVAVAVGGAAVLACETSYFTTSALQLSSEIVLLGPRGYGERGRRLLELHRVLSENFVPCHPEWYIFNMILSIYFGGHLRDPSHDTHTGMHLTSHKVCLCLTVSKSGNA